ncbi:MAG TPA: FmdB family zinc ribbon protein [Acidimicrobiales bacterium]|nr:FmdB family zinc ribbon protein [Acidimicrobiales bacterium]
MPTYEYACKTCGEHIDVVQSFGDEPLTVCPACGGELRKVFGAVGVVFKGSGFYKTDSRPSPKKAAASSGDGSGERAKEASANGASSPAPASTPSESSSGSGGTDSKASSDKAGSGSTGKAAAAS